MKFVSYLLTLLFSTLGVLCDGQTDADYYRNGHEQAQQKEVTWHADFAKAHALSKKTGKPLFILFTGSDWCTWCKKLEREVLHTPEFARLVAHRMIFVKADFPMRNTQPMNIQRQNEKLQRQFSVEGFPTVLCLDPGMNKIATLGYRRGGGKRYAQYVLSLLEDYDELAWQMKGLEGDELSAEQLKEMYEEARESGHEDYIAEILAKGLKLEDNSFFLLERYRELVEADKENGTEAQELRQALTDSSRKDRQENCYRVAVIDFQRMSEKHREETDPEAALTPLKSYLSEFGDSKQENLWKVHMMVSQVYSSKSKWEDALKHAQLSHEKAPEGLKADVEQTIQFIQEQKKPVS